MRSLCAITLLCLGSAASAQEVRSPIARCADAAAGTEVEVCMLLAAEHPDQVDGIAAALRAHIARAGSADRDLLLALLALIDDQTAVDATQRMADLADPRGLPALVACAQRRSLPVAGACLRAQVAFDGGVGYIAPWLVAEGRSVELRVIAAQTLGQADTQVAADALIDALRRPRLSPVVRKAILETIRTYYPDRADALRGQVASDGRAWLTVGGGFGMGYAMGAAGYFGQTRLASLGWVTGAVGGSTAGWLYGRAWPMEAGDAAYITTGGILGTTSGILIGTGIHARDSDALYGGGLIGMAVGYGATAATRKQHLGTGEDAFEASGVATLTSLSALSVVQIAQRNRGRGGVDPDAVTLASGIGLAGGTVVGHAFAPAVDLHAVDGGFIALSSAYGLAFGSLVPVGGARRALLPALGATVGGLTGYGLSVPLDFAPDVQGAALAGAVYGGALGGGLGLVIDPKGQTAGALALGVGTAGLLTAGVLSHRNPEPLDDRDVVLVGLATTFATWQSAGWAATSQPEAGSVGWFVMAPAAAGAITALATPMIDVPVPHAVAASSVGLWGAYGGGIAAELTDHDVLTWSLIGSDAGLVGGALLMSPLVAAPPVVIGVADAGGVLGGSVAALGAAFATDNEPVILTSSLIGAGVGFASGAALGAGWKKGGTRDMARTSLRIPGRWSLRPQLTEGGYGMAVDVTQW